MVYIPEKSGAGFAMPLMPACVSRPQRVVTKRVWHPTLSQATLHDSEQHRLPEEDKIQFLPVMWKDQLVHVRVIVLGCGIRLGQACEGGPAILSRSDLVLSFAS